MAVRKQKKPLYDRNGKLLKDFPKDKFEYEIMKHFATISTSEKGWTLELNLVSWNGEEPKIDLRRWSPDHKAMRRGICLNEEEIKNLIAIEI